MDVTETKCFTCIDKIVRNGKWICTIQDEEMIIGIQEGKDAPCWCYRKEKPVKEHWKNKQITNGPHHLKYYLYRNEKDFKNDMRILNDYKDAWWDVGIWGIDYYGRKGKFLGFEYNDNYQNEYYLSCDAVTEYLEAQNE